jgi:hypothetical protein
MRIRSTKPEFWRSERISDLSWDARLVLKGLESYVDDNGAGKDDVALIVGDVFPRDMVATPRETVARVSEAVSELHRAGFIHRYTVDGTRLLFISWWDSIQRIDKPGKGRFPRPDGTMNYRESEIRDSVASAPETVVPGTGEQRNRGTEEEESCSPAAPSNDYPAAFSKWWQHYPRKTDKRKALGAWQRARKRASDDELIDGAIRYAKDPNRHPEFTKQGERWLNGDCWLDDPLPPRRGGKQSANDRLQAFLEEADEPINDEFNPESER